MGRDEHNTNTSGRTRMAQTPEYAKKDGQNVDFFEEFAGHENKETQAHRQAQQRTHNRES